MSLTYRDRLFEAKSDLKLELKILEKAYDMQIPGSMEGPHGSTPIDGPLANDIKRAIQLTKAKFDAVNQTLHDLTFPLRGPGRP